LSSKFWVPAILNVPVVVQVVLFVRVQVVLAVSVDPVDPVDSFVIVVPGVPGVLIDLVVPAILNDSGWSTCSSGQVNPANIVVAVVPVVPVVVIVPGTRFCSTLN
jgi:hypothetical protein